MTSRRDVEQGILATIVREARGYARIIGDGTTETDLAIGLLVRSSHGTADRLQAAAEQLEREDPDAT